MSGDRASLFTNRYNCQKLCKRDIHSLIAHTATVKTECHKFKLKSLTADQFECLTLAFSLQSARDDEIRTRIIAMSEQDQDITLQTLVVEA